MIMHKGKQVGFIQHENNNIDKVMHNGNCVFEQGYPRDNNTITGDIVLDGTIGKSLKSWSITGNTVQDGTPSPDNPVEIQSVGERTKNLFDVDDCMTQFGKATKNENGNWVFDPGSFHNSELGMSKGGYKIQPITGENVTFSATFRNVGSLVTSIWLCIIGDDDNWTLVGSGSIDVGKTSKISISSVGCKAISFSYGSSNNWELISPQLEIGSSATSYEPYGYKIPVVTRGKNLFDYKTMYGVQNKYLNENGEVLDSDYWSITDHIPCSGNVFTINRIGGGVPSICLYDSQKNFITGLAYGTDVAENKKPITIRSEINASYIRFSYCIMSDPLKADDLSKIQVEQGPSATIYQPYKEPITTPIYLDKPLQIRETLNSDGTRDVKWDKVVLTGDESGWERNTEIELSNAWRNRVLFPNYKQKTDGFCSHYIVAEKSDNEEGIFFGLGIHFLTLLSRELDTAEKWASWLAEQYNAGTPVTVYYQSETPTTETIEVPQIPTFRNTPTIKGIMTSLSVDTTIKPSATNVSFRSTNKYQRFISRYIDFDNNKMSTISGDFSNIRAFTNRRRCNVLDDGTISAFYGDDNYVEDGSNGQVMVYQPKFYYKVEPIRLEPITDSIGYHIREAIYSVSDIPLTGYKLHPAFINEAGNEVDYFCLSAFEGCAYDVSNSAYITNDSQTVDFTANTGDKLSSIANVKPMSGLTQRLTRPNSEIIAKNRGAGWHTYGIKQASANQLLMFIEYGNLQSNIGLGVVSITDNSSYNCSSYTGSTSSLGNTTGRATSTINEINGTKTTYTDNGKTSISYRGMENPYGNIWDFVYGVNIHGDGTQRGGIPYICTDYNYAESKNSDNYVSAGFTTVNANRYIKAFGYGNPDYDWLFIGSDTGGTSGGIIGDYHYVTANLNGYRIALLGGSWATGSSAGGFFWDLHVGVGSRYRSIGARLCYVPQK